MDAKEQDDLENDFSHDGLSEVEGPVHNHGPKLDQNHDQERSRHLILRQRRRDVCRGVFLEGACINAVRHQILLIVSGERNDFNLILNVKTYTKRPESKHNDDEVDCVGEEHHHIDVCDGAVLWMDQVMEELPHGKIDLHEPAEK